MTVMGTPRPTEVCPYCERPLDNPAAELAVRFARDIDASKLGLSWVALAGMADGGTRQVTGYGIVHKVATSSHDEERNHGGDTDAFIIIELGGFLFRKDGVSDSYGDTSWNGLFRPVQMKTKTITSYE